MDFNDRNGKFFCENKGLIFVWDYEPEEEISDVICMLTENYYSHLDEIVQFMLPDLKQVYEFLILNSGLTAYIFLSLNFWMMYLSNYSIFQLMDNTN